MITQNLLNLNKTKFILNREMYTNSTNFYMLIHMQRSSPWPVKQLCSVFCGSDAVLPEKLSLKSSGGLSSFALDSLHLTEKTWSY